MRRLILLILVFIIICYFQYNYINNTNNSYDILQYENPNKAMFENIVKEKSITILTHIPTDELIYNKIHLRDFFKSTYDKMTPQQQSDISQVITKNFKYYDIPLKTKHKSQLYIQDKNICGQLKKQIYYRHLICVLKGTLKIALFSPNNEQHLYFNNNISKVDIWNQDLKKYSNIEKAKYVEILLHENQLIYIPLHWIYSTITNDDCVYVSYSNESFFSSFLKNIKHT